MGRGRVEMAAGRRGRRERPVGINESDFNDETLVEVSAATERPVCVVCRRSWIGRARQKAPGIQFG